jgi:hypothetical protein
VRGLFFEGFLDALLSLTVHAPLLLHVYCVSAVRRISAINLAKGHLVFVKRQVSHFCTYENGEALPLQMPHFFVV